MVFELMLRGGHCPGTFISIDCGNCIEIPVGRLRRNKKGGPLRGTSQGTGLQCRETFPLKHCVCGHQNDAQLVSGQWEEG